MDNLQQSPPLLMDNAEPGGMVHQPRLAIDPGMIEAMKRDLGLLDEPIMQTMPMARPQQQQRDMLPIYMICGMGSVLMGCCVAMVAIANSPSSQVARANEQMAAVAVEVAKRPTCEVNALIALPGACPFQSPESQQQAPQPQQQQPGVMVANNAPLPAEVPPPPAPNPFMGMGADDLTAHWNQIGCVNGTSSQDCADIAAAYSAIAPAVGGQ